MATTGASREPVEEGPGAACKHVHNMETSPDNDNGFRKTLRKLKQLFHQAPVVSTRACTLAGRDEAPTISSAAYMVSLAPRASETCGTGTALHPARAYGVSQIPSNCSKRASFGSRCGSARGLRRSCDASLFSSYMQPGGIQPSLSSLSVSCTHICAGGTVLEAATADCASDSAQDETATGSPGQHAHSHSFTEFARTPKDAAGETSCHSNTPPEVVMNVCLRPPGPDENSKLDSCSASTSCSHAPFCLDSSAKQKAKAVAAADLNSSADCGKQRSLKQALTNFLVMDALQSAPHAPNSCDRSSLVHSPVTDSQAPAPTQACEADNKRFSSRLLSVCPAVPCAMARQEWCLGDYSVVKRLYKGSMSAVYKAVCLRSGLAVALKVYFLHKVPSNVVHMIYREIGIHGRLMHKHTVMLYGAFQDAKRIVLVQSYAARGDLFGIHKQLNGCLPEAQAVDLVLRPLVDCLAYLHAQGVCHRDIKPENLLLTEDFTLKLADFGVSIDLWAERAVTRTGTTDYMAPEVERCPLKSRPEDNKDDTSLAYSTAADVWSVGILAYELLVGFPPFSSQKQQQDQPGDHTAAVSSSSGSTHPVGSCTCGDISAPATTRHRVLQFPSTVSESAKMFIRGLLAPFPGDRPTSLDLRQHPWLASNGMRRAPGSGGGGALAPSVCPSYPWVQQSQLPPTAVPWN